MAESLACAKSATMSSCLMMVDVEEKVEGIPKKRRMDPSFFPCLESLENQRSLEIFFSCRRSMLSWKLEKALPCLYNAMMTKDLTILKGFISGDTYLSDLDYALHDEVVAWCVWCLFGEVPQDIKRRLVHVLECVIHGHLMVTDSSTDETAVETLLVHILHSKNVEVIRQACFALSFSLTYHREHVSDNFGADILDRLLELVPVLDPKLHVSVLQAIAVISSFGNDKREKIVKSELSVHWLAQYLKEHFDDYLMEQACWILNCIVSEECDGDLWKHVKDNLVYHMLKKWSRQTFFSPDVLDEAVASVVLKITIFASSADIKSLVDFGCLRFLVHVIANLNMDSGYYAVKAIENILEFGDEDMDEGEKYDDDDEEKKKEEEYDSAKKNKYAKMIDGFEEGWEPIVYHHEEGCYGYHCYELLLKYRPHLLEYC